METLETHLECADSGSLVKVVIETKESFTNSLLSSFNSYFKNTVHFCHKNRAMHLNYIFAFFSPDIATFA